jgi:hypothetical protein
VIESEWEGRSAGTVEYRGSAARRIRRESPERSAGRELQSSDGKAFKTQHVQRRPGSSSTELGSIPVDATTSEGARLEAAPVAARRIHSREATAGARYRLLSNSVKNVIN